MDSEIWKILHSSSPIASLRTRIDVLVTITVTTTVAIIPIKSMNSPPLDCVSPDIPERLKAIDPRAWP